MTEPSATALIVETTATEECPVQFLGDSADIVYFISFAHSQRYGADHPLSQAAALLKRQLRIKLSPLLTFADARTDSDEEERALAAIWQDAAPLAECARSVAEAILNTQQLRDLTTDLPELPDRLRELADMAAWAADRGARVRLIYVI
ncbi:MAG: hypothetical protein V3S20_10575 [Dehalococcoidia bacterium]